MGAVKRENLIITSEFIIMKIGHHVRPLSNRRRMAYRLRRLTCLAIIFSICYLVSTYQQSATNSNQNRINGTCRYVDVQLDFRSLRKVFLIGYKEKKLK